MLYFLKDKSECTGCTACVAICPHKCITMERDERGFLYPAADKSQCIDCGMCKNICHMQKSLPPKENFKQFAVAARSRNNDVWKKSTSGGAFSEICNAAAVSTTKNEVYVFGAGFEQLNVIHSGAKWPQIDKFRRSKYIQSDMKNCFSEIKELLQKDVTVIFSGTPCQVGGLKSFLKTPQENLICVEFICHGVGSPLVFQKYIDCIEKEKNKKVKTYEFRTKKRIYGRINRYTSKITYDDNSSEYVYIDNYNKLFLEQLCLRDCCGEKCKYRNRSRTADITIADFNNFMELFPEVRDERDYSAIIVNSPKGLEIYKQLEKNMIILPCDIENIIKYNPLFAKTTPENKNRTEFFEDFCKGMNIAQLCDKYCAKSKRSIRLLLKGYIPYNIKYLCRRLKILLRSCENGK